MGRISRSDGAITRARILEAAGTLIAQQGYAQTTNKEIARVAEVDLAAINYHFNGREGLYLAVLSEAHHYYLDGAELQALADSPLTSEEKLEAFLEICLPRLNEKQSWHCRVYTRELLSPSSLFNDFMQTEGAGKRQAMHKLISQIAGLAEDDPLVLPCLLSIVGPCMMLMVSGRFTFSSLNGLAETMSRAELVAYFKQFSLAGLSTLKKGGN
ncbi:MAG TPA: TetR/AcrR family transcriptional regulator [Buttiauxella sp.]|uniref:TetR/AcrR family transcriptional regulator n=1 Tax=Buttiauxella sp. TaxID=1972222 RepID=UPI002B4619FD|nr:TetR/AcrR family transcriptional regulator [Buttiauxella sp.]HKM96644.1 TetR/AcrR family transcriptional regulator [Buttiauxella sp.]